MKTFDRKETKYSYCTRNKQKVTIGWTYFRKSLSSTAKILHWKQGNRNGEHQYRPEEDFWSYE